MQTIPLTDADLLTRYLRAGDEDAFAALLRTHERLVIGTATRVTGDAELAHDVAQQVFATLAQKAWLLTDRTSLAGWLHHVARHVALRAVRSEVARQRRHEQTAGEGALAGAAALQVGTPAVVVAATVATTAPLSLTLSAPGAAKNYLLLDPVAVAQGTGPFLSRCVTPGVLVG